MSNTNSKRRRPALHIGQRVTVADIVSTPIRIDGRPDILRDTVLRVWAVTGKGTLRAPWQVVVTTDNDIRTARDKDAAHFWHFDPTDLAPVTA